jgi:hypothetical protein
MWRCCDGDELLAAAMEAQAIHDLTAEHIRALRLEDFFDDGPLKDRFEQQLREREVSEA